LYTYYILIQINLLFVLFLTVIQCPMTRDNSNGTVVSMTGLGVNDTVIYKCPIGFRVIDIGSIYYNLTCIHVPNTTIGVWSDYPQFEGTQPILNIHLILIT
jgi:hypothetical protein